MTFEQWYENKEWKGYTKFLPEVFAVKAGVKPVMRIPISKAFGYPRFKELCKGVGVLTGLSDYTIKEPYKKEDILPAGSSEGDHFMYVSMSDGLIEEAKKAELVDEERFGELMGYPKCCIDHYHAIIAKEPDQEVYEYWRSGRRFCWHNNYLLRFNSNYYLHAYFICSFDCKESIENAKRVLECIKDFDRVYAKKIEYHLKLPILFDDSRNGGIIFNWNQLKGAVFDGNAERDEVSYKDQFSLWQGGHFPAFRGGDNLKIEGDSIIISKGMDVIRTLARPSEESGFIIRFG